VKEKKELEKARKEIAKGSGINLDNLTAQPERRRR